MDTSIKCYLPIEIANIIINMNKNQPGQQKYV